MITKEQFEKIADIELIEKDGKLVYYGYLDLEGNKDVTELPDNLIVFGYLDLCNSGVTKLPKGLEVKCWLDISDTDIEELPEDTKFNGGLSVNRMKKPFSFPKVVKTDGYFDCENTTIKIMPETLYVNWKCNFSGSTFDKYPKVMEIRSSLSLYGTPITEIPEGLNGVYGAFNITNTKVSKLPNNLVVSTHLTLRNTPIEELPKGLIVGDELNLLDTNLKDYSILHNVCSTFVVTEEKYNEIKYTLAEHSINYPYYNIKNVLVTFEPNYKGAYLFENEIGRYIKADGILAKIVEQKGNVYHIVRVGSEVNSYLVTDGEGRWSHGCTLEEAKADLLYKIIDRDKSVYENLTLDSELSFKDAIVCYRVITGACSFGTRDFIENRLGENKKDKYTISEIIKLTEGEYGGKTFKEFFFRG